MEIREILSTDFAKVTKMLKIEVPLYWMELAANHGDDDAKNNLGIYYQNGIGVERDLAKAIRYFREAAENGNFQAQFSLGLTYFSGNGVPQDYAVAVEWFEKAAAQNEPDSQYHLYLCYSQGLGVEQDEDKAFSFLQKAADNQFPAALQEKARLEEVHKATSPVYVNEQQFFENCNNWGWMCLIENGEPYVLHHHCAEDRTGKPMDSVEYQRFFIEAFYECLGKASEKVAMIQELPPDDEIIQTLSSLGKNGVLPDIVRYHTFGSDKKTFYAIYSSPYSVSGNDFSKIIALCKSTDAYGKIIVGETYCMESHGGAAINGAAFVARFKSYPLCPSEVNPPINEISSQQQLVEKISQAWKSLDVSVIEPYLDARMHYGSDWVFHEMSSRAEYLHYLKGKFNAIKRTESEVKSQIDRDFSTDMYSVILTQDGDHTSRLIANVVNGRIVDMRMKQMLFPDNWQKIYEERIEAALPAAGNAIETFLKQECTDGQPFGWLTTSYNPVQFHHLCFTCKGNVYSVLIALVIPKDDDIRHTNNLILPKDVEKQLREANRNNLIPCIIPLDIQTLKPLIGGLHLVHTETKMNVALAEQSEKSLMSDWEIQNWGIQIVADYLKKEGNTVNDTCDAPTCGPNIWFYDKSGKKSYVVVNTITANNKWRLNRKIWNNLLMDNVDGYYAQVTLHSDSPISYDEQGNIIPLSERDNPDNPVDFIFRGDGVYVQFRGLEYIEKAAARMGVSDKPTDCW